MHTDYTKVVKYSSASRYFMIIMKRVKVGRYDDDTQRTYHLSVLHDDISLHIHNKCTVLLCWCIVIYLRSGQWLPVQ